MFNYKKLAALQTQIATLQAEVERLKVSEAGAHALRESVSGLYDRLVADKDALIERQISEIADLRGKISLMETIMMPLSSNAGAAYQQMLNPPKKADFKTLIQNHETDWQRYKSQKDKELEESYKAEEKPANA